jgi:hypothetical protein
VVYVLIVLMVVTLTMRNSNELTKDFKPGWRSLAFTVAIAFYALLCMDKVSEFLYFNF